MNETSLCLLHHAVTWGILCGCNSPPRGISYTQCWSERWVHTCTSAPGNASPQRSRKVLSEGFIQRCSALGGNRLHWWLIYTINTKEIGFFSPFFLHSLFSLPLVSLSLCSFCCLRSTGPRSKKSLNIFSSLKSCSPLCYISWALLRSWQEQLTWNDGAVAKCLICTHGCGTNQQSRESWADWASLVQLVVPPIWSK